MFELENKLDVVSLGEYLIDFTPIGSNASGYPLFEMNPGGAPVNCIVACSLLGGKTSFIGTLGDDNFGRFLKSVIESKNINSEGITFIPESNTTLVFVMIDESGDRQFEFVGKPGADTQLKKDDINFSLIDRCKYLHFGTISLIQEPSRTATLEAINYAKSRGKRISYDPNYRLNLWPDKKSIVKEMIDMLSLVNTVKCSLEEMQLLFDLEPHQLEVGASYLLDFGVDTVYITMGKDGAYYATENERGKVDGFQVNTIDTTGCGDAFMGAALFFEIHKPNIPMQRRVMLANAVGAICSTRRGGLPAMPSLHELEIFLEERNLHIG
ncbi:MAG: carbohydrate kinase family protein [Anaerolineaceae bacterium]